jgi:hypothetical protein
VTPVVPFVLVTLPVDLNLNCLVTSLGPIRDKTFAKPEVGNTLAVSECSVFQRRSSITLVKHDLTFTRFILQDKWVKDNRRLA